MEFEGILRIRKKQDKKGKESSIHTVEFTNQKGKSVSFPVMERARYYNASAKDGDACHIFLEGPSTIVKCVVPGKEAEPNITMHKTAEHDTVKPMYRNNSSNSRSIADKTRPIYGYAPYNFVPYRDDALISPKKDEIRKWSGQIVCRLTALTPLLVSGKQARADNAAGECAFMQVNGKRIIPGTAIKGMLRALMEILSFSGMRPINKKRLFWRDVSIDDYRKNFSDTVMGGFLTKKGADYYLREVTVTPVAAGTRPYGDSESVKTGGFIVKGNRSKDYLFELPGKDSGKEVDREIVMRLWRQLTPNQESKDRWPKTLRDERLNTYPGLPVFFRCDEAGEVVELGFCRYFRLEYKYSPYDLAWPEEKSHDFQDMAQAIFGHTRKTAYRGRVAIEPFEIRGQDYPCKKAVVLASPKPTCLPFYLQQDPNRIKVISGGKKNEKSCMNNYNSLKSRLRGRKLYWHHEVNLDLPDGNDNQKTRVRLHPLDKGATGEFVIHVDRLTDTELGCLFEALELREGCAHKLGMGRSLGFGSVQIDIKTVNIVDVSEKYLSLSARLKNDMSDRFDDSRRKNLRAIFREYVFESIKKHYPKGRDFYSLEPIEVLFMMLDFKTKPTPAAVATMSLKEFSANPLLPTPREVMRLEKRRD